MVDILYIRMNINFLTGGNHHKKETKAVRRKIEGMNQFELY
jgi:hypothetical protein